MSWCCETLALVAHLSYSLIMAANAFVRARIDGALRDRAAAVLADMGLTVSDVVRIVLTRVAKERALPFEMRVPNKLTAETLAKSERGEDVHHAKDANDLFKRLGI
jgi:DNA-damage-inducible protein J